MTDEPKLDFTEPLFQLILAMKSPLSGFREAETGMSPAGGIRVKLRDT
jgi:hypothetical protein